MYSLLYLYFTHIVQSIPTHMGILHKYFLAIDICLKLIYVEIRVESIQLHSRIVYTSICDICLHTHVHVVVSYLYMPRRMYK